jgi:7-cyano-7-deazaguanine synthase
MDSSTLLLRLLYEGYEVTTLSFDYGQKHKVELERAKSLVSWLNFQRLVQGKTKDAYPMINHQVIEIGGLGKLLNSSLVEGGGDVPEGHYEQNNMKETVVPNRNKIFSSIIQAVALSLATKGEKHEVKIGLGIHAGDHAIYPDCRQEFRDADMEAFKIGNWDSELVKSYTPYLDGDKFTILKDGAYCCEQLGLNFDEVYKRTNTSYKPILIETPTEYYRFDNPDRGTEVKTEGTRKWYSDYKSASSVERIEAFIKLGRPDPVEYADETGPVSWETAKSHVEQILNNH